jgi:SOS-response transcriptional repressor LexA
VELRPANAQMTTLRVDAQDVEVKGIVAGLIRKY